MKQTCLDKYGVEFSLQAHEVQEKRKQTCLDKYGVEFSLQAHEVQEKRKQTCVDKYGVENPSQTIEVKEKIKQTCLDKYGVENPLQVEDIKNKFKQTCLDKYGVENPSQVPDFEKKKIETGYSSKVFMFPSGEKRKIQGYEPFALKLLVEQGYTENDIVTDRTQVPQIWYEYNEKHCCYFPDIYIQKENRIIEVKSPWTYNKQKEKNIKKGDACKKQGYFFELWVFDYKGTLDIL